MSQLPEPIVELPGDQHNMSIVGNPIIPKFYHIIYNTLKVPRNSVEYIRLC